MCIFTLNGKRVILMTELEQLKQENKKLKNELDFYKTLGNYSHNWEYFIDALGNFLYCSESCESITGYTAKAFYSNKELYFNIIHPADRHLFKTHISQVLNDVDTNQFQFRILSKGGEIVWIEHSCKKITNAEINISGIRGSNKVITKQKNAELALKESKAKLATAQKIAKLGIWELNLNNGTLYWSDEIYSILELNKAELSPSIESLTIHIHPDDRTRVNDAYKQSLETKAAYSIEYRLLLPDGNSKFIRELCDTKFDTYGAPLISRGTMQDITHTKKLSDKLDLYSKIVEQSPTTIVVTDLEGSITYANPAFYNITGYSPEEVKGNNPRVLKGNVVDKDFYENLWNTISNGDVWYGEFINKRKDRSGYIEKAVVSPYVNKNGKIEGYFAIKEDITKQKEAEIALQKQEAELRLANVTKDKFFKIIAHDLKSPFSTLIGFSNLLLTKYDVYDNEQRKKFLALILDTSTNTYNLLNNLLKWSMSQTDGFEFIPTKMDISDLVRESISILKDSAKSKEITITTHVLNRSIVCDKEMINTTLRNLISNAIKYTPRNGSIDIEVTQNENDLLFAIKDSGIGMSSEQIDQLFDLTKKNTTPGTENEKGTGLGLILSKEFVEKHGGELSVSSELNAGTTFQFNIPIKHTVPVI